MTYIQVFDPFQVYFCVWGKDLNVSHEIIKHLDDNIGKHLLNIGMSNFFLNASPRARETKVKMNSWDYIKLKSFCTAKDTINRTKSHPTVWENIFVNDISDKGLTSKIYKELTCLNTQKANNPINKWAEDMKTWFIQRRNSDGQQTHEKMLHITNHQGNAIKTTVRYHRTPVRMATIQKTRNNKC